MPAVNCTASLFAGRRMLPKVYGRLWRQVRIVGHMAIIVGGRITEAYVEPEWR